MIDDSLFEYLQISIVQYFKNSSKTLEDTQQSLDSLGFRVGYNLIERYNSQRKFCFVFNKKIIK